MGRELKECWVSKAGARKKPWGEEIGWSGPNFLCSKIIRIKEGHRTSLKKYRIKNESFYVASGSVLVLFGNEDTNQGDKLSEAVIQEGDVFNVPSGCPYRLTTIEDSLLFEVSNHNENSEVVWEDDYDRE